MSSGKKGVRVHIQTGNPEFWFGAPGLDSFSKAFASFRLINQGLRELLGMITRHSDAEGSFATQVRRAMRAASLVVPDEALDGFVKDVANIYIAYSREVMRISRESRSASGSGIRAVHVERQDRDPATENHTRYVVTAYAEIELEDRMVDEFLRNPLITVVAPYVSAETNPVTSAAELGLNISLARKPLAIQLEALLVSAVASLDGFLFDVIWQICRLDVQVLRASKLNFSALNVLDAKGHADLLDRIREDLVSSKTRSFGSMCRFLESQLKSDVLIDAVREPVEARNVIVHHAGLVSRQYLDACPDTSYQLEDRLVISEDYLRKALRTFDDLCLRIVSACRDEYGSGDGSRRAGTDAMVNSPAPAEEVPRADPNGP
jgi:hypothetical protein